MSDIAGKQIKLEPGRPGGSKRWFWHNLSIDFHCRICRLYTPSFFIGFKYEISLTSRQLISRFLVNQAKGLMFFAADIAICQH